MLDFVVVFKLRKQELRVKLFCFAQLTLNLFFKKYTPFYEWITETFDNDVNINTVSPSSKLLSYMQMCVIAIHTITTFCGILIFF